MNSVEKTATGTVNEPENEKKSIFKKLASMLGVDMVEKGAFADEYAKRQRQNNFWTAFYALEDMLSHWDSWSGENVLETDETKVREALEDFSTIISGILTSDKPVTKQIAEVEKPVEKAGKKISNANRDKLQGAYDTIGELLTQFADPEPDDGDEDAEDKQNANKKPKNAEPDNGEEKNDKEENEMTKAEVEEVVKASVADAVAKALEDKQGEEKQPEEAVTKEMVQEMVTKAVAEAIAPVFKSRGVPSAMNDGANTEQPVEKHYLHGII